MPKPDGQRRLRILVGWALGCGWLLSAPMTLAGTASSADTASQQAATSLPINDKGAAVQIDNFDFAPMTLTVAIGTTVTWTNHDDIPHTVVSADNPAVFKSPPLDTDDAYSFTFTIPGAYKYFCSVHPKMVGMVVVRKP